MSLSHERVPRKLPGFRSGDSHISSICRKTEASSRQDLISLAEAIGGEAHPRTGA